VPDESAFKSRLDIDSCLCNTDTGWTELVESWLYTMHVSLLSSMRVVCIIPSQAVFLHCLTLTIRHGFVFVNDAPEWSQLGVNTK
jgi:hypothetical protein